MNMQEKLVDKILASPVIPVFYDEDPSICIQVMESCYRGGIRVFEFVSRGHAAESNFQKLLQHKTKFFPELSLGVGTILNHNQAQQYIDLGCEFLVSPLYAESIAETAKANDTFWIPGCMTPTEIGAAREAGFHFIKVFPGGTVGPAFVKSILPLFPDLMVMPTGGVACNEPSIRKWFDSGVKAVGLGSQLFEKTADGHYAYQKIEQNCTNLLSWAIKGSLG